MHCTPKEWVRQCLAYSRPRHGSQLVRHCLTYWPPLKNAPSPSVGPTTFFCWASKKRTNAVFTKIESTHQNWTLRELRRQFQSGLYERLALSRDQDGIRQLAQQGQIVNQPKDLLKEPLVLEFLGLSEQARFSESDLEADIILEKAVDR